ncbi:MAG TPA: hypothetical protein PKD59_16755 [Miltoncostaeaceae bacterium]|nr:hypothetical protein [Miltoncostaeaceae bacterium]
MRARHLRHLIAALGVAAVATAALPGAAPAEGPLTGVIGDMYCVAPTDAAGIDAILADAGSPMAGEGATIVTEAAAAGIDPRAIVAIAAHETMLETYGPAQAIHNPFGLGPGIRFPSERAAIVRAVSTLAGWYLPEGRTTLATIGAKWAPVGASNDPGGLNANWTSGTGAYYAAMGGDPSRTVLLADQAPAPGCAGAAPAGTPGTAPPAAGAPSGPPVVTAWSGAEPQIAGPAAADGADPATGRAATIPGFVFPLALAQDAPATFRDQFAEPGPGPSGIQGGLTVATATGAHAVAAATGTLHAASPGEREAGIAFWLDTPGGDRIGYGPLISYADGIGEGSAVTAGARLGDAPASLRIAWERGGVRIDPFPLLQATRPSA